MAGVMLWIKKNETITVAENTVGQTLMSSFIKNNKNKLYTNYIPSIMPPFHSYNFIKYFKHASYLVNEIYARIYN